MQFEIKDGEPYGRLILNSDYFNLAENEPKIGHWEYVQYDYNPNIGNWHCSECRNIIIECTDKNKRGCAPTYSYCPYCGVKMSELLTRE